MKYTLKEKQKRKSLFLNESTHAVLKSMRQNLFIKKPTKLNTTIKLSTLIKLSIKIRLVNRCVLTDRKNRFHLFYKFSRLVFLKLARNKDLLGLNRHSW
uniref:ribosomal protein S14 n=1 Tax=Odontella aurita TaxID=265563 RepID=UPI0020288B62|nr:ribosomal protein S14 [Odontella aurita]QYB22934.1 ribosomal protein S14 [Odontella aurita]